MPSEKKRSVYAPIQFRRGIKFSRCLIDTGSQVNLIPKADVTKNQFVVSKNDIQQIYGFNGDSRAGFGNRFRGPQS